MIKSTITYEISSVSVPFSPGLQLNSFSIFFWLEITVGRFFLYCALFKCHDVENGGQKILTFCEENK